MSLVTLFADPFSRADGLLGADWDDGYTPEEALQIVSNAVLATTMNVTTRETQNAAPLPADQWAELVLKTMAGAGVMQVDLVLRSTAPATRTAYEFQLAKNDTFATRIRRRVNGTVEATSTEIDTSSAWADGDTFYAEVIGSTLIAKRNGVTVVTWSDSAIASGARSGFRIWNDFDVADTQVESFATGVFSAELAAMIGEPTIGSSLF